MEPKKIADLNGKWSILFRVLMVVGSIVTVAAPFVMAWGIWVTGNIYALKAFRDAGDRFTAADGERLRRDLELQIGMLAEKIDKRIDALPPDLWRQKIDVQGGKLDAIEKNQIKIMIQLDSMADTWGSHMDEVRGKTGA